MIERNTQHYTPSDHKCWIFFQLSSKLSWNLCFNFWLQIANLIRPCTRPRQNRRSPGPSKLSMSNPGPGYVGAPQPRLEDNPRSTTDTCSTFCHTCLLTILFSILEKCSTTLFGIFTGLDKHYTSWNWNRYLMYLSVSTVHQLTNVSH